MPEPSECVALRHILHILQDNVAVNLISWEPELGSEPVKFADSAS